MIISRKKYERNIKQAVEEAICKVEENHWRAESERNKERFVHDMERRLIEVEKKSGIDHPSHHRDVTCKASW